MTKQMLVFILTCEGSSVLERFAGSGEVIGSTLSPDKQVRYAPDQRLIRNCLGLFYTFLNKNNTLITKKKQLDWAISKISSPRFFQNLTLGRL